jgi:hypothetical protein
MRRTVIPFPQKPLWRAERHLLVYMYEIYVYRKLHDFLLVYMVLDNAVGIASRYRLDCSGFEPYCIEEILSSPDPSRPALGLPSLL